MWDMEKWLAHEKEEIIEKLHGARLCGEVIDLENPDMVIVAAYHLGWLGTLWKRYE